MPSPKYPHARLSPAKDEILAIAIIRESVVKHDIRPLLDKLLPLAATRESAIAWEGKVTFNLLLGYMNGLYERLDLPEAMNERISQEIAQLIECSLQ